jgi:hypothetical protein
LGELQPELPVGHGAKYDSIVALAALRAFRAQPGVSSMVVVLLIAGIGFLLAGLLTIGFGIPVKEFSFGNTLILAGTVGACTGMVMLGLWMVVRELKNVARRLGPAVAADNDDLVFSPDQPAVQNAGNAEPSAPSPPWHEDAASRDRVRGDVPAAPEPVETASAAKQRRNLLFSSSARRERERARATDPSAPDARPAPAAPPGSDSTEGPRATFEDAWPKPERSRTADAPPRRSGRAPSTFTEANAEASGAERQSQAARKEDQPPPVTVLKSGVVDGMAYSLYSDGSIEAQMPEGMMRFASIDELRAHLDQRP